MKSLYPFFRLLWRPGVAVDLVTTGLFATMLALITAKVRVNLLRYFEPVNELYTTSPALNLMLCLLTGAVIGLVANFALQDLAYNRFARTLPGLKGHMRKGLFALAALTTLLCAVAGLLLGIFDRGPGLLQGAALGLLGFALGNQIWDPKIGRGFCFGCQFLLFLPVLFAEEFASWIQEMPWALPLIAPALAVISIRRSTQESGFRLRALVPKNGLGISFRNLDPDYLNRGNDKNSTSPSWGIGSIATPKQWADALLHEVAGQHKGGWTKQITFWAILITLLVCGGTFALKVAGDGTIDIGLNAIVNGVFYPQAALHGVGEFVLGSFFCYLVAFIPLQLILLSPTNVRRGVHYPLSRSNRANMVWRASLRLSSGLIFTLAGSLIAVGLLIALSTGVQMPTQRIPDVLICTGMMFVWAPMLCWARLRLVDSGKLLPQSAAFGALSGSAAALLALFHVQALKYLHELLPMQSTMIALILIPFFAVLTQLYFRRLLQSWFKTADLV